jgi:cytochrome c biogenesis protein CcmG, thiol:disulfide interchange protein DsbE
VSQGGIKVRISAVRPAAIVLLLAGLTVVPTAVQAAPGPAPAFTLELFNGKTLSLSDLKGTAVILLFWAQW